MRHSIPVGSLVLTSLIAATAAAAAELEATRTLEETVPAAGAPRVIVDNVFGSIHITAHDRDTVEMSATETIRAKRQSDLDRARTETGLKTERDGDEIAFLVRRLDDECDCDCCRWNRWDGYVVEYDIELRVPQGASLDVSTVNNGEIVVDGVHGDFEVSNVNGAVTLRGLRGSGSAETVNGDLDATFDRAPAAATSFKTVNGQINVSYPARLSADLRFKTMRGEIWTDFDAEPLSLEPVVEETQDRGMRVIRTESRSAVRVGSGGPMHSFETLNGDIYVNQLR